MSDPANATAETPLRATSEIGADGDVNTSSSPISDEVLLCDRSDQRYKIACRIGSVVWGEMVDFVKPTAPHLKQAVSDRYQRTKKGRQPRPHQWSADVAVKFLQTNTINDVAATDHTAKKLWEMAKVKSRTNADGSPKVTLNNKIRLINTAFEDTDDCSTYFKERDLVRTREQLNSNKDDRKDFYIVGCKKFNDKSW